MVPSIRANRHRRIGKVAYYLEMDTRTGGWEKYAGIRKARAIRLSVSDAIEVVPDLAKLSGGELGYSPQESPSQASVPGAPALASCMSGCDSAQACFSTSRSTSADCAPETP